MICEFVNWIIRFVGYGFGDSNSIQKCEYTLSEALLNIFAGIFIILCVTWWLSILRYLYNHTLKEIFNNKIVFKCKRSK